MDLGFMRKTRFFKRDCTREVYRFSFDPVFNFSLSQCLDCFIKNGHNINKWLVDFPSLTKKLQLAKLIYWVAGRIMNIYCWRSFFLLSVWMKVTTKVKVNKFRILIPSNFFFLNGNDNIFENRLYLSEITYNINNSCLLRHWLSCRLRQPQVHHLNNSVK